MIYGLYFSRLRILGALSKSIQQVGRVMYNGLLKHLYSQLKYVLDRQQLSKLLRQMANGILLLHPWLSSKFRQYVVHNREVQG